MLKYNECSLCLSKWAYLLCRSRFCPPRILFCFFFICFRTARYSDNCERKWTVIFILFRPIMLTPKLYIVFVTLSYLPIATCFILSQYSEMYIKIIIYDNSNPKTLYSIRYTFIFTNCNVFRTLTIQ